MANLTKRTVDAALRARGGRRTIYDDALRGFGLRVGADGRGTYVLKYFLKGHQGWYTLGKHGEEFTPDQARARALDALTKVRHGIDPVEAEREERARAEAARDADAVAPGGPTVAELAKDYLARGMGKLAPTTREDRRSLLREGGPLLRYFGERKVAEIDRRELLEWWSAEVENAEGIARKTGRNRLDALAALFTFALVDLEIIESSPVDALRAVLRKRGRTKSDRAERDPGQHIRPIETADELEKLLAASAARPWIKPGDRRADRDGDGHLITLLLLDAGLRLGEALGLRWADVNFGKDGTDPARSLEIRQARARGRHEGTTKSGRGRTVALSRRLRTALLERYMAAGRPAATARVLPDADAANYRKRHFAPACAHAKLGARRPKDLRDTFASQLLTCGVSLGYVSKQLGHSNVSVTANHYARWCGGDVYRAPLALELGEVPADLLARLSQGTEPADFRVAEAGA